MRRSTSAPGLCAFADGLLGNTIAKRLTEGECRVLCTFDMSRVEIYSMRVLVDFRHKEHRLPPPDDSNGVLVGVVTHTLESYEHHPLAGSMELS